MLSIINVIMWIMEFVAVMFNNSHRKRIIPACARI